MAGRASWQARLRRGVVIPAHPLALTAARKLDERRQRALTRYYLDAGAGGVALGVHTTQFAIRSPKHGLLAPVLELGAETVADWEGRHGRGIIRVAGVMGPTRQAVAEARLARELGYHIALLSLGALARASDAELLRHVRTVAQVMPVMGFYLQPAVGGRKLSFGFWRRFAEIPEVRAIKIAPFNRYATGDVVRAVGEAGRAGTIALYTGNDDNIVPDLVTRFPVGRHARARQLRIVGGLLGHWAFWTRKAVALLERCHTLVKSRRRMGPEIPAGLLSLGAQITDANGAIFDAAHDFRGCIPGIHEVLRRQGLLKGTWCLDPKEGLSPGQKKEIDRVTRAYPHLNDDAFVEQYRDLWLK